MTPNTDRIERTIHLKASRDAVWRALSDAESFGEWFGVNFKGRRFTAGQTVRGNITYPGWEHVVCEILVEKIEPEYRLAYRWHPYAIDPNVDYSDEPTTLVEFELADADGGTLLHITESGFDRIPAARHSEAYRMNSDGWDQQVQNIAHYLAAH